MLEKCFLELSRDLICSPEHEGELMLADWGRVVAGGIVTAHGLDAGGPPIRPSAPWSHRCTALLISLAWATGFRGVEYTLTMQPPRTPAGQ